MYIVTFVKCYKNGLINEKSSRNNQPLRHVCDVLCCVSFVIVYS